MYPDLSKPNERLHVSNLNSPPGVIDFLNKTSSLEKPHLLLSAPDFLNSIKAYLTFKNIPFAELPVFHKNPSPSARFKHLSWKALAQKQKGVFLSEPLGLLKKTSPLKSFLELREGDDLPDFVSLGYKEAASGEMKGHFCLRGYALDLFSPAYSTPVRIELSGNKMLSFSLLDEDLQKRKQKLPVVLVPSLAKQNLTSETRQKICEILNNSNVDKKEITAISRGEHIKSWEILEDLNEASCFLDCFPTPPSIWIYQFNKTKAFFEEALEKDFISPPFESKHLFLPWERVEKELFISMGGIKPIFLTSKKNISYPSRNLEIKNPKDHFTQVETQTYVFLSQNHEEEEKIKKHLLKTDPSLAKNNFSFFKTKPLLFIQNKLEESWINETEGVAYFLSKNFISRSQTQNKSFEFFQKKVRAFDFAELKEGGLIVHRQYGIGSFKELKTLTVGNIKQDFFVIQYKQKDKLMLPAYKANEIKKYSENSSFKFKDSLLDSLRNPKRWDQKKQKAKLHIREITLELLSLYKARTKIKREPYKPALSSLDRFSKSFPFEETRTQNQAISEVLQDMDKDYPMERLLCADVGFGKTEVALRAVLRAVEGGFQVCFLAPTTILSLQHYENFKKRFSGWPINLVLLNRFINTKDVKTISKDIKEGRVDFVIATHQVLNSKLFFKNLGLCIIDEEHRFGVKQKEHFKRFNNKLDVLSLSATPLPRTLNIALSGLKDISVISDPPKKRKPVKLFIHSWNNEEIKKACEFEKNRQGQIIFIHNRIKELPEQAEKLKKLLPDFKIAVAHGRLNPKYLETLLLKFFNKEFDLLLCTTLVESGIDMPETNTLFINKAEALGLGQIYQLKGRVGRSSIQAYCYLLTSKTKALSSLQEERLELLEKHKGLGSGFHLALRDLETRGAGEIFGAEQSGHLTSVGQDLYFEFLNENLKNSNEPFLEPEIKLPFSACLPEDFLPDSKLRLLYYKNLSDAKNSDDLSLLKKDLKENFGMLPKEVLNLFLLLKLRNLCVKLFIRELKLTSSSLTLIFDERSALSQKEILKCIERENAKMEGSFSLTIPMNKETYQTKTKQILTDLLNSIKE